MKKILEDDPPYCAACVDFHYDSAATGWNAPATRAVARRRARPRVDRALRQARRLHGRGRHDSLHEHAEREVPGAQLLVTGVLGPKSNAHGPNEFIDIAYAKKVTAATAMVIAAMD